MTKMITRRSLTSSLLGVVLATQTLFTPVQAGLFAKYSANWRKPKSYSLPTELKFLRDALVMADEKFSVETTQKELGEELDGLLATEYLEKNKGQLAQASAAEKAKAAKAYLDSLSQSKRELERDRMFLANTKDKYALPLISDKDQSLRSREVWLRTNQKAQNEFLGDLQLDAEQVKPGHKMGHKLDVDNVPYGGNFFPDNFGGIARRWNNNDLFNDEIFDYKTFHEGSLKDVYSETEKRLDEFKKKDIVGYEAFKAKCRQDPGYSFFHKRSSKVGCYQKFNPEWTQETSKKIVIEKIKDLSPEEFNALSPTEKWDIANGYYDFRTTIFEKYHKGKRRKHVSENAPFLTTLMLSLYWEGRCNADRACGICNRHTEPVNQLVVDIAELDKKLVFEPLDIKALYMSTFHHVEKYAALGERNQNRGTNRRTPPNMAAFDVLLRGAFSRYNFPFVIDNHADSTVNNVTVVGYEREVVSVRPLTGNDKATFAYKADKAAEAAKKPGQNQQDIRIPKDYFRPGSENDPRDFQKELAMVMKIKEATKVMKVKTKLKVLTEVPVEKANGATKKDISEKGDYTGEEEIEYELYLNDKNEIVDGQYLSGNLDFVWFAGGKGTDEDYENRNKNIKYDVLKGMATKSSKGEKVQVIDRGIFPGNK